MIRTTALAVFVVVFLGVTAVGFASARWRRGDLTQLAEWGLGGRRFGPVVMWFLIGGDIYTAYTVVAVPALVYGQGAPGFFAVPYTIFIYPIAFVLMPRLWNVCSVHGWVTPADFVRGRYGSPTLALLIALTGILATLPYIALQLVGMQAVIAAMGVGGSGIARELPLALAFVILAAYTYTSGLRAPAAIAFVKDAMIVVTVLAAVVLIPPRLGGFGAIFAAASAHFAAAAAHAKPGTPAGAVILAPRGWVAYGSLALGSALAVFMYPHAITAVLASARADVIRRNAVTLPFYSLVLGLVALLGYMAIAAHLPIASPTQAVPALFGAMFPQWFAGFAFAAIAVGALVPAAIMSIAAANLWTRNVYKAYLAPHATDAQEARMAKAASLVVKLGALGFVFAIPLEFAIDLQLLGGIWMLQTLPAIGVGLFRRVFHDRALVAGWVAGMAGGTWLSIAAGVKPTYAFTIGGTVVAPYIGIDALALNLAVSAALTLALDRSGVARRRDVTLASDFADPAGHEPSRLSPRSARPPDDSVRQTTQSVDRISR